MLNCNFTNKNIKYLREIKNISQEKLANELKVDQSTLAKWEKNSRKITLEWALKISNCFNIPVGDFITIDLRQRDLNSQKKGPDNFE